MGRNRRPAPASSRAYRGDSGGATIPPDRGASIPMGTPTGRFLGGGSAGGAAPLIAYLRGRLPGTAQLPNHRPDDPALGLALLDRPLDEPANHVHLGQLQALGLGREEGAAPIVEAEILQREDHRRNPALPSRHTLSPSRCYPDVTRLHFSGPRCQAERALQNFAPMDPILLRLSAFARLRRHSPRTIETYIVALSSYLREVPEPFAPARPALLAWLYAPTRYGRPRASASVHVRFDAVRFLLLFARDEGIAPVADPLASLRRPRIRAPLPRGLEPADSRALLSAIPATPTGIKYRAYLTTALLTGLRFAELRSLTPARLEQVGERTFLRVVAKGQVERRRELPAAALVALELYTAGLHRWPRERRFFPMGGSSVRPMLHRLCDLAQVPRICIHGLRHSAALLRRAAGASLEEVSAFLGHLNLATTSRYLTRLERPEDDGAPRAAALLGLEEE